MPTIPAATTQFPCKYFFAKLDASKAPIPGTMYSRNTFQVKAPCREAFLPPYQMDRTGQCFHANHQRFFYRYDNINKTVVGNSLVAVTGGAPPKCQLGETLLEYIIHS